MMGVAGSQVRLGEADLAQIGNQPVVSVPAHCIHVVRVQADVGLAVALENGYRRIQRWIPRRKSDEQPQRLAGLIAVSQQWAQCAVLVELVDERPRKRENGMSLRRSFKSTACRNVCAGVECLATTVVRRAVASVSG